MSLAKRMSNGCVFHEEQHAGCYKAPCKQVFARLLSETFASGPFHKLKYVEIGKIKIYQSKKYTTFLFFADILSVK